MGDEAGLRRGLKRGFRSGDVPKAGEDGPVGNPGPCRRWIYKFHFSAF
ncbi:hypothetical protein B4135_1552 [Caldibacillus debilis]|uniref:Uncharacterized protein n=1 Tax=Caldibacillus debilis TaxID=301148 RepID=A0A150MBT9_9BACI|nr:hypothetical protein B4135_1552 [Caldibacillus debilis]